VHLVRLEDVLDEPRQVLGSVCARLGLETPPSLSAPSWNGAPLAEVSPWGTIREPTPRANRATAAELSPQERETVRRHAAPYLDAFDYSTFL
jgi:hypothetical protein